MCLERSVTCSNVCSVQSLMAAESDFRRVDFRAGVLPVYFGAPDITNFMPPESFIHGNNYTYDELGKLINTLNNDPGK